MTTELTPYSGPEYELKHDAIRQQGYLTCLRLNDGTEYAGQFEGQPLYYNREKARAAREARKAAMPVMDDKNREMFLQEVYWALVKLDRLNLLQRLGYWWWRTAHKRAIVAHEDYKDRRNQAIINGIHRERMQECKALNLGI